MNNVRQIGEVYGLKRKIMEITKEQIRSIVITRIPFAIINSKGKMKYPFISSNASEQVVNALVNGIYEELSKLHQPTVSNTLFCYQCNGEMQYSGLHDKIECVECGCDLAK
jgi:hypothetical protein